MDDSEWRLARRLARRPAGPQSRTAFQLWKVKIARGAWHFTHVKGGVLCAVIGDRIAELDFGGADIILLGQALIFTDAIGKEVGVGKRVD